MNGRDRHRLAGEIPSAGAEFRRPGYGRNSEMAVPGASATSLAEKFDDEKRRIMGSCFAKVDGDNIRTYSHCMNVFGLEADCVIFLIS